MHRFSVPTMTCGGCLRSVTRAVQNLDPGAQVEGDLQARRIAVTTQQPQAALLSALAEAGYPAEPLPEAVN
jgi:copper chaperone